ncbi:uncharacterized protein G2W53_035272 [Senna tora]|uniref:Uncharacterized protein n=1 Tax=Senna tora TaxID=362788 RepID=A0A834T3A2_9FABA|nr:uncharacterized protein G2W53_035272 [Senna tora]
MKLLEARLLYAYEPRLQQPSDRQPVVEWSCPLIPFFQGPDIAAFLCLRRSQQGGELNVLLGNTLILGAGNCVKIEGDPNEDGVIPISRCPLSIRNFPIP